MMLNQQRVTDNIIGSVKPRYKQVAEILRVNSCKYNSKHREHIISGEHTMLSTRKHLYQCNEVYTTKVVVRLHDVATDTYVYAGDTVRVFVDRYEGIRYWFGDDWALYDKPYDILLTWSHSL